MSNFKLLNKARLRKEQDAIYGSDESYGFTGVFMLIINGYPVKVIACDGEEWKPVKGYDREYEVSTHGRVRSLSRVVQFHQGGWRDQSDLILSTDKSSGYPRVTLGHDDRRLVHVLAAEAFLPNPKQFTQVNHRDGNKLNTLITNLEWCSGDYNAHHAIEMGLRDGWSSQQIEAIKLMFNSNMKCTEIAELMNASRQSISGIVNNRHRNLNPEPPEPNTWMQLWQHVSVSISGSSTPPSWSIMCKVKDLFFEPEDCVVQYHPPKSQYVNTHPGVLHLWRPLDQQIPMPPTIMV